VVLVEIFAGVSMKPGQMLKRAILVTVSFVRLSSGLKRNLVWRILPSTRPRYIALLGGPGAGKGTVASQLSPALSLSHVSTGALIRREIANKSDFGRKVQELVEKGHLIPDEMALTLLASALKAPENSRGVILDGFPRSLKQAQMLDELLANWGLSLEKAVWLELSEADLIERLSLRRTCSKQRLWSFVSSQV
jgi:adenylate kinase family enzyme